jgi:hypothetical protein
MGCVDFAVAAARSAAPAFVLSTGSAMRRSGGQDEGAAIERREIAHPLAPARGV